MKTRLSISMAAVVLLLFGGCGSSSSSDTSSATQQTGYFVDSKVQGLDYKGSNGSHGTTDSDGGFTFKNGERITFSLGDHTLGTVTLDQQDKNAEITPIDLIHGYKTSQYSATMSDSVSQANLDTTLRTLQTADEDSDTSNGIQISENTKDFISRNFSSEATDSDVENLASHLGKDSIDTTSAREHFQRTLDDVKSHDEERHHSDDEHDEGDHHSDDEHDDSDHNTTTDEGSDNNTTTGGSSDNNTTTGGGSDNNTTTGGGSDNNTTTGGGSDNNSTTGGGSTGGGTQGTPPDNIKAGNGVNSTSGYTLLAWNDLGMHCMDGNDYSVFSILPPYNTLNAQLILKNGTSNKHVTSGVTIKYTSEVSLDGKYNTTSMYTNSNELKTNFWDYASVLYHAVLDPDIGLTGNSVSNFTPHELTYNADHNWWEAVGIPMTPYNDDGSKNYYPLVTVSAFDQSGAVLASTTVVLPVSDEMDCKTCHSSTSGYSDAQPNAGWENDIDAEKDFKYNILRLHDELYPTAVSDHQTELQAAGYTTYDDNGLYTSAKNNNPVLCATCHSTNALGTSGVSNTKPLTEAMHSKHANVTDPTNSMTLGSSDNRSACYRCHPGATTKCLRGAMGKQSNIQCQSCHGNMSAVGTHARNGWLEEPNCQSCHQDGNRYTEAVTNANTGTLRAAVDTRFATNANTPASGVSLYRFSTGHGDMQCSACHGSTHAIYPSEHAEDNLQSIEVQGFEGTIAECTACHDTAPSTTTGGPHGMHTAGNDWVKNHDDVAEKNHTQCASCHGADYRGTELSKMFTTRVMRNKTFAKGQKVGCYDCHNGPNGD
ncbi:multiheme c-type cytochrome [Sulfurimonas sp.]|uniref:multiheme c-type cytochrome n=1 Tax=Sulfurimonas sp. TaxID=2022749 RepID=UPI003D146742